MSLEQPTSATPPAPPLTRDSPGIESDYCSDYGSLSSTTDPLSLESHRQNSMSMKSDDFGVLEQLMNEVGSEFGFVLDRNGTIEMVVGKTQPFFGNIQIEKQKLLKFVAPTEYQKVCGLLPSAASSSSRKSSSLIFCSQEKTKPNLEMEIISQLISANADNPEKGPCVVCVAKRLVANVAEVPQACQESRRQISFSLSVDKTSKIVKQADLRMEPKLLSVSQLLDKSIYELCYKTSKDVIDTIVDAVTPCQAKLVFVVNEYQMVMDIANFFDPSSPQVRLECNGYYEVHQDNLILKDDKMDTVFVSQPQLEIVTQHITTPAQFIQNFDGMGMVNGQIEAEQPAKKQRKPRKPRSPSSTPKRSRSKKAKDPEPEPQVFNQFEAQDPMKAMIQGQAYQGLDGNFYYQQMGPPPPYTQTEDFGDTKPKGRAKKAKKTSTAQPPQNVPVNQFIYQNQPMEMQFMNGYPIQQDFTATANGDQRLVIIAQGLE
ncbi:unnamed protein product [Bursaphelenchus okinawaensis]|uniref:Uncharacterized protein n=1 Tax=Bursaphelenchus okinawaensis TaxID=465554 RepID=A0A811LNN1_9BILA|nr:unnamed protein product [Bursaphelenchus okinawaensis]CAG9124875.1 unnamed protein product [Bursaphelenchus okinawaensis]